VVVVPDYLLSGSWSGRGVEFRRGEGDGIICFVGSVRQKTSLKPLTRSCEGRGSAYYFGGEAETSSFREGIGYSGREDFIPQILKNGFGGGFEAWREFGSWRSIFGLEGRCNCVGVIDCFNGFLGLEVLKY
jgi:hypothetical protein